MGAQKNHINEHAKQMFTLMGIKKIMTILRSKILFYWTYDIQLNLCKTATQKSLKIGFQDQLSLNAGQKYCRMLHGTILQYFRPSLSYHLSLRSLFCLFLSGRFTQVLLYKLKYQDTSGKQTDFEQHIQKQSCKLSSEKF